VYCDTGLQLELRESGPSQHLCSLGQRRNLLHRSPLRKWLARISADDLVPLSSSSKRTPSGRCLAEAVGPQAVRGAADLTCISGPSASVALAGGHHGRGSASATVELTERGGRDGLVVLDLTRTPMRGVHDLHRCRARGRLHRPDIGHAATIRPRLVHTFDTFRQRTRSSPALPPRSNPECGRSQVTPPQQRSAPPPEQAMINLAAITGIMPLMGSRRMAISRC
jgi:hypothetical protein